MGRYLVLLRTIERIYVYFSLKKIKKYLIENCLLDKLGSIDFWNEHHYFLTANYMIIIKKEIVYAFPYSEIEKIDKKSNVHLHGPNSRIEEYLYITTKTNEFKVLISTTLLVGEEYRDISHYLLNKNPNIKVNSS